MGAALPFFQGSFMHGDTKRSVLDGHVCLFFARASEHVADRVMDQGLGWSMTVYHGLADLLRAKPFANWFLSFLPFADSLCVVLRSPPGLSLTRLWNSRNPLSNNPFGQGLGHGHLSPVLIMAFWLSKTAILRHYIEFLEGQQDIPLPKQNGRRLSR